MRLTVVTATMNVVSGGQAANLRRCVESVASVPCEHEHLIYDGASSDGTVEILHDLERTFKGVKVVSEKDRGIYDALNKGVCDAAGEYFYCLGADDFLCDPVALAKAVEHGERTGADIVISPTLVEGVLSRNPLRHRFLEAQMSYSHQGVIVKTRCMRAVNGFDCAYRICADLDAIQKLHLAGASHAEYPKPYADRSRGGASSDGAARRREDIGIFAKNFRVSEGIATKAYDERILPLRVVLPLLFHKSPLIRDAALHMLFNHIYRKVKTPSHTIKYVFDLPVIRRKRGSVR